jgi:hypothetical protein
MLALRFGIVFNPLNHQWSILKTLRITPQVAIRLGHSLENVIRHALRIDITIMGLDDESD